MNMSLLRRILNLFRRRRAADIGDELAFHIEERVDELVASGMDPAEARRLAHRQFGNLGSARERTRDAGIFPSLDSLLQDAKYAARTLRARPVFSLAAILSLALGIGANIAIFIVVNTVLLKMLPVRNPEELVILGVRDQKGAPGLAMPYPAYELLQGRNAAFPAMLAFATANLNVAAPEGAEQVQGTFVSGSYFSAAGIEPMLGRAILRSDDAYGAPPVAVISHSYWRRKFSSAPDVAGRSITLNGVPFTIAGVAPPHFYGLQPGGSPAIYIPFHTEPLVHPGSTVLKTGFAYWMTIMARLPHGASEQQALASLEPAFADFLRDTANHAPPNFPPNFRQKFVQQKLALAPAGHGFSKMQDMLARPLAVLMGVAGLVLLLMCANLAHLLLGRTLARRSEIALRAALGAGRTRIVRQLLTESLLLAIPGGIAGLLFASAVKFTLLNWFTGGRLAANEIPLDLNAGPAILLFTLAVTVLAALLFGTPPALAVTREALSPALKHAFRRRFFSAAHILTASQVALSLVLLLTAGLFVRTFRNLAAIDPGFSRDHILVFKLDARMSGYSGPRLVRYYSDLLARLAALPGVSSAALSQTSPVSGSDSTTAISEYGSSPAAQSSSTAHRNVISPGYFAALGIPLLAGRDFSPQDAAGAPKTAIINETFAKEILGSDFPVGKRLGYGPGQVSGPVTVIGVVKDSKYRSLREPPQRMVYLPYTQADLTGFAVELRVPGDPAPLWSAIRREAGRDVPVLEPTTLARQVEDSLTQERLISALTSGFGLIALLLAAGGLFGATHYAVTRRIREIGVRMALGATPRAILNMMLRETMALVAFGLLAGIPAALALSRLLTSLLYGVSPTDPAAWCVVLALLFAAALTAGYLPTRRALHNDPVSSLRHE